MREKLPVYLENRSLPKNQEDEMNKSDSYGFVSILYILSIIITLGSIIVIMFMGK